MDISTKTCGRCGGSGRHSFNYLDGDRCYGCGGTGVVPCTPKGQKAIKPTADLETCWIGDIIKVQGTLYEVSACKWTPMRGMFGRNSKVVGRRLVDGQMFRLPRDLQLPSTTHWTIDSATGERTPGYAASDPGAELYGQDIPQEVWESSLNYRQRK